MSLTKVKAGNIILTTPSSSSNDTTPATTQYVTTAINDLIDTAPSTLNTLNELAAALGDDVNFSTTVTNSIATKAPLASPTLTGNPKINVGTDKNIIFSGVIGEIGNVAGFQAINDAGSANTDFGIRATTIRFATGSSERMRIDSNGNVGIGNSSLSSLYWPNGSTGGLFLQAGGLLSAYNAGTNLSQNWYYNSGEKFIGNGGASRYVQSGQEHIWSHSTAVNSSGAGAGLTWSESMRIDSSGNVGIGTDNPAYKLDISGTSNDLTPLIRGTVSNTPSGGFNWATEFIAANLADDKRLTHIWGKARTTYGMAHVSYLPKSTASESYLALGLWGANDILNVLGNGNVGIGTTGPHSKLQVLGAVASGTATKPTHAVYDASGNMKSFEHVFSATKGTASGALNKTLVDVSGLSNFHQAIFIVEYGTRLQAVSDSVSGFVHRVYALNRFNGGSLNVTETTAIAGSSNSLAHALIDVEIVSNTQYRIRVEFSSSVSSSSFASGTIRAYGLSDYFPTISFAEGMGNT